MRSHYIPCPIHDPYAPHAPLALCYGLIRVGSAFNSRCLLRAILQATNCGLVFFLLFGLLRNILVGRGCFRPIDLLDVARANWFIVNGRGEEGEYGVLEARGGDSRFLRGRGLAKGLLWPRCGWLCCGRCLSVRCVFPARWCCFGRCPILRFVSVARPRRGDGRLMR